MVVPLLGIAGLLLQPLVRLQIAHRRTVLSAVLRVLIVEAIGLCPGTESGVHDSCRATKVASQGRLPVVQEGIIFAPRSRVSLQKTTSSVFVHLLKGEVFLERRAPTRYAVTVTAGNAQLSNIKAVVCVGVWKDRTVVTVLDGSTEMSVIDVKGHPYGITAITLQAGDRVELLQVGAALEFHFRSIEHVGGPMARQSIRLDGR